MNDRSASLWAIFMRPNGGDVVLEDVMTIEEVAAHAQPLLLRLRYNPSIRCGWFKGAPHWTREDMFRAFNALEPESRKRYYDRKLA